jgi:S-adenosylmethionine-dependent methyltransferase
MKKIATNPDLDRFQNGAAKYAAYLKTAEGRLRLDLTFANLQEVLPQARQSLRALDIGCGTGDLAIRLARLGARVALLDASSEMLEFAKGSAEGVDVMDKIALKHGDAHKLADLLRGELFDVVLCHNVLEYVDDPATVLRSAARFLRDRSSILSVLVRNQAGEVLKAAIKEGDLTATENNLTAEWGHESLYGGEVRLFTAESLRAILAAASLTLTAEHGVRVLSDYLPPTISVNDEYERIFELERKLGSKPEFAAVARYTHGLSHRAD